jgi:hypothetical protein
MSKIEGDRLHDTGNSFPVTRPKELEEVAKAYRWQVDPGVRPEDLWVFGSGFHEADEYLGELLRHYPSLVQGKIVIVHGGIFDSPVRIANQLLLAKSGGARRRVLSFEHSLFSLVFQETIQMLCRTNGLSNLYYLRVAA